MKLIGEVIRAQKAKKEQSMTTYSFLCMGSDLFLRISENIHESVYRTFNVTYQYGIFVLLHNISYGKVQ